jgi:long-subunit acyl-CoA synthetase (AMP-forming)
MVTALQLDSLLYVIRHTKMAAMVLHPASALALLPHIKSGGTSLRVLIIVPHFAARTAAAKAVAEVVAELQKVLSPTVAVYSYEEALARPTVMRPVRRKAPEELTTLSCTSGSTGDPKLCMMLEKDAATKASSHSISISRAFVYW